MLKSAASDSVAIFAASRTASVTDSVAMSRVPIGNPSRPKSRIEHCFSGEDGGVVELILRPLG